MKFVGADLGNDSTKIVFGPQQYFRIPNAVSQRMLNEKRKNLSIDAIRVEGSLIEMENHARNRLLNDLDVVITSNTINGRFFVGELASRNGENEILTGTPKADNPFITIPLIAMLALDIPSSQHSCEYKVVCGLPISEYTQDRERYREKLIGEYEVEFQSETIKNRRVKVIIKDAYVVPEGVAVVLNRMLNETATGLRNPSLRQGHIGVIDIGAFTTDIPVIVNGKPDSDASEGIAEGIANYLDKIVRHVNETYGVNMSRSQLVGRLETGELEFPIKGKPANLRPIIDEQFQIFARRIVSLVDSIWENHFEIREFFVVGGGAKALKDHLTAGREKRNIHLTFIQDEDPQMQNALGYWKYAKQKFGG